jgi:Cft2 family RNA processing exonuclease
MCFSCPGSVLFLFKLRTGQILLHTGDFRANEAMQDYTALQGLHVNQLYLDTTYVKQRTSSKSAW